MLPGLIASSLADVNKVDAEPMVHWPRTKKMQNDRSLASLLKFCSALPQPWKYFCHLLMPQYFQS